MSMRKAMLLKLNGVEVGSGVTQDSFFDVLDEGPELGSKHTHRQVRTVRGRLAG